MKKLLVVGVAVFLGMGTPALAGSQKINGAGATFPYPLYAQWAYRYKGLTGVQVNYQSIGSGGGIAQIKARTVDFGASDAPMKPDELASAGLIQFPMAVGGVVPVVNVKGITPGGLRLSAEVLADIYLGKITKWNDPAIAAINPGVDLKDGAITVVHRADGSGTTWIYTHYLQKVSAAWRDRVGFGKAVDWPVGIGGKGNEGVAAYVKRIKGAIGYVEFAYALQNKMAFIKLQNKAGNYVDPTIESFQAAAANADWEHAPGYFQVLTDQPGASSWPITGATFVLIYKNQPDANRAGVMLRYFDWCFNHGADVARKLHYVPLPENVIGMIENTWRDQLEGAGRAIWPVTTER